MQQRSATARPSPIALFRARALGASRRACANIAAYVACCRDAYAATALYDELSKLSDAELQRRGIARGDLHRLVAEKLSTDE
jgi:hypothetical protein